MSLNVSIASLLEVALNAFLRLDPEAVKSLDAISGKIILLSVRGLGLDLYLFPRQNRVDVQTHYTGPVDTTITGSPAAFIRYGIASTTGRQSTIELNLQGDIEAGQVFQKVLSQIEFDWEEMLAQRLGDIPAHQMGNLLQGFTDWFRHAAASTRMDISEYLLEESGLTLSRVELEYFLSESDTLRSDIDRLEARLERLELRQTAADASELDL